MKRFACMLVLAVLGLGAFAQTDGVETNSTLKELEEVNQSKKYIPVFQYWKEHDIFQHLDLSVTLGTTGIGIDVASPVTEWAQLRLGYEFMPRFTKIMRFDMTINGKPARSYDEDGNRQETNFDKLKEFLYDFTGLDVEDHADMLGKPTINNFKFLVDVFPFKDNKHWHFTAGFYWGPSKFAEAVNTTESMNTLISLGIYNNLYWKAEQDLVYDNPIPIIQVPDPDDPNGKKVGFSMNPEMERRILEFGRMGFHLGEYAHDVYDANGNLIHSEGDPYMMEADENNMVRVRAKSNSFKPYIGFGYGGRLLKNRDDWKVSVDAGVLFWGGTPDLYAHDGTNLMKDVKNIGGQVGDYIDLAKKFPVYPSLSIRFTKTLF